MRSIASSALLAASFFAVSPASAELFYFQSPSGNIHCEASDDPNDGGVRCDVMEVDHLSFPDNSPDCDLDEGKAFWLGTVGPGVPACAGDVIFAPDAPVLPYGESRSFGDYIVCYSERNGMECQNRGGFGFFISRSKQMVY